MNTILIVDDIAINRSLLRQSLEVMGDYNLIEASGGKEAIEIFNKHSIDLVLLDIMMPGMDGCQTAIILKEKMAGAHVPIIFITALTSEGYLATALESGGDDFLSKPFNFSVLSSKITAHLRIRELSKQLSAKNESLTQLNEHLINEQELIEHFFESSIKQSFLDANLIKYHMSSMSVFNGDVLLSERGPQGSLYMIVGDFSGHGLTAAMGTLPVAMIFFKMTSENASVAEIAREINFQLLKILPSTMFLTASILELTSSGNILTVWMGGMPENYWFNKEGELKGLIESQHMPLGILSDDEFDASTQVVTVEENDKIYLYTDGVTEAKNSEGELFGDNRLKNTLMNEKSNRFSSVLHQLSSFTSNNEQNDDITLVELNCGIIKPLEKTLLSTSNETFLPWDLTIKITDDDLVAADPVRRITNILSGLPGVSKHEGMLYVLLKEIFYNSLDHSILNLESADKSNSEDFIDFYTNRDEEVKKLESAFIAFYFKFFNKNENYYLQLEVTDSGNGFRGNNLLLSDASLYGRGLNLIHGLSEKAFFANDGKTFTVLCKL